MAKPYTALAPLFDDIADAIRFKDSTTAKIPAEDFPERILAIQSGGIQLESISITTPPAKTSYHPGESFDPAGMVVAATYSNGATATVTGYAFSPSGALTLSDTEVTISYMEYSVTAATTVPITVQNEEITVPTQSGTLTYDGYAKTPQWDGYDPAKMTIGGTTSATGAGSYDAEFTPLLGYVWPDGTAGTRTVSWAIGKADGHVSVSPSSITLDANNLTGTAAISSAGDGALTAQSDNPGVATVEITGKTLKVSSVNAASGTATVTVTAAESANYTAATATVQVNAQFSAVVGVKWDSSNPSTAMTRLTTGSDPNGFVNTDITTEPVPAVGNGEGSSPFDGIMPWKGMEEYNIIDGEVSYKRGDAGFSRSAYDTMVYIPEFWCKTVFDGNDRYFYVSDVAKDGFERHPGSGKYVGRYNTGAGYVSKTGLAPLGSITRAQARTGSAGKGSKWCQYDFASWCAVGYLFRVEFADWDSQAKVGRGIVDESAAHNSGETDSVAYHTGRAAGTDGKTAVQYRHIENPWGNVYDWVDGINFNERAAYICLDRTKFADDTATNYAAAGVTLPSTNGYIRNIGFSNAFPWAFVPNEYGGGSETTFIPDRVYSNSGWRVLYVGGSWSLVSNAGLFYFLALNASSSASAFIGSRLLYNP